MVNIIDDPDGYTVHRWPRYGTRIRWIIVHDPAADRARPEAILRVLRRNSTGASYNELIYRPTGGGEPESHVLSDPSEYVGHAGVQTRIPKTAVRNGAVNRHRPRPVGRTGAADCSPHPAVRTAGRRRRAGSP